MTRARNVVHKLLEDGPEERVDPKAFIGQNSPERYLDAVADRFRQATRLLEKAGVLEILEKKCDEQAIGLAILRLVIEQDGSVGGPRAWREMKKLAQFRI